MEKLWNNVDTIQYVDIVLIQRYSGWRPQELGLIEIKNVDLKNWTFTGRMKTDAGKARLELNPQHRAHDGRKHFVSMAKRYEVDEYAIKYMIGHEITDLTERVYTERNVQWLKEEIEKIK